MKSHLTFSLSLTLAASFALAAAACDDDKSDLVSKVVGDASTKPVTTASALSALWP